MRDGGIGEGRRYFHLQRALQVDGARQHAAARINALGNGFARQGRGVHLRGSLKHQTVQGNFFAGAHNDAAAGAKGLGRHVAGCAAVQHLVGNAGARRQQSLD